MTWADGPNLPNSVYKAASVVYDDKLYVAGARESEGAKYTHYPNSPHNTACCNNLAFPEKYICLITKIPGNSMLTLNMVSMAMPLLW